MGRVSWVDNVKSIAVFLVILGHFSGLSPTVKSVIYSFHIPAFLFVTGFLLVSRVKTVSFFEFLKKNILPYSMVYLLFSLTSILFYAFNHIDNGMFLAILKPLEGAIYGVHGSDKLLIHSNGPLWYFPFLLVTLIVTYFITRLPVWLGWIAALSYCAFSILYTGVRLPWCIDIAGVGVLFSFIGYNLRINYDALKGFIESRRSLIFLPLFAVLLIFLVEVNGYSNLNKAIFGENSFLYVVNAIIGVWCLLIVAHNLPSTKLSRIISVNTLTIFCVHIYLVKAMKHFPYPEGRFTELFVMSCFSVVILMICLLFSVKFDPLLRRYILRR